VRGPDFMVGLCGLFWAEGEDRGMDDEESDWPGGIEDARVHEELAEVTPDVGDGRGIGGAEVDEQDCLTVHG
jgi:hypothetical protein